MKRFILLFLICNALLAQKKTGNDFSVVIHEESINKIISAIGPINGSSTYDIYVTDIKYNWTVENARLQVRPDSSRFVCDVKAQAGILKYKTQVHGDVKISYDPVSNQIQVKIVRAVFELYTQLFGKKIHIKNIDLAENFAQPFIFEGPRSMNTSFDFKMTDGSIKKIYIQPSRCTIELKWKEILVLFDIDACDTPFNTWKTSN